MLFSLVDTVAYEEFLGSSHMADHCGLPRGDADTQLYVCQSCQLRQNSIWASSRNGCSGHVMS